MTHHPVPARLDVASSHPATHSAAVDSKVRSDLLQRAPVVESRLVTPAASSGVVTMVSSAGRLTSRCARGISPNSPLSSGMLLDELIAAEVDLPAEMLSQRGPRPRDRWQDPMAHHAARPGDLVDRPSSTPPQECPDLLRRIRGGSQRWGSSHRSCRLRWARLRLS